MLIHLEVSRRLHPFESRRSGPVLMQGGICARKEHIYGVYTYGQGECVFLSKMTGAAASLTVELDGAK